jgi:CDP-paratose 2-epimerase
MGGSRHSNISMLEAIDALENKLGWGIDYHIDETKTRKGDHIWYVSDVRKFQQAYPNWQYSYTMQDILDEMVTAAKQNKIV